MSHWLTAPGFLPGELGDPPATPRARTSVAGIAGALALMALLAAAMIGAAAAVHALRSEPRDAVGLATRELTHGMLDPGEHPLRTVQVFRRAAGDYFRATHGLLILTERRVLYAGLVPRDIFDPGDELPTFERLSLTVDTTLTLATGRTRLGGEPALVLATPHDRTVLGVEGDGWPAALAVVREVATRQTAQRAAARAQRLAQAAADAAARRPVYHVVQRGEALEVIARRYNTTIERLRELNGLKDNRIRVRDSLLVKPQS